MALVAGAVCPNPPLLVPELAAGASGELAELRDACRGAVRRLAAAEPDLLYVVGADTAPRARSFAPWGSVVDGALDVPEPLPLALLVGGWLTAGRHRSFVAVDGALDTADCTEVGVALAGSAERVALLVMGDGSARRSRQAPGYEDARAEPFDRAVVDALARADAAALLELDPALAEQLMVAGRAAWQVLAGAAGEDLLDAAVLYDAAPYGVGYVVATWSRA